MLSTWYNTKTMAERVAGSPTRRVHKERPVPVSPAEINIPIHPEAVQKHLAIKTLVGEHPRNRVINIVVNLDPDELLRITLESESWQDQDSTCQFIWSFSFKSRKFDSASWKMRTTPNSGSRKPRLQTVDDQLELTQEQQKLVFQEVNSLIKEESGTLNFRSVV